MRCLRDVVAYEADFADKVLAERRNKLRALVIVRHDLLAMQQFLCCSPGCADVTIRFVELELDVVRT
jgi:hypothetical protein